MPRVYCVKCGARLDFDASEEKFAEHYYRRNSIWTLPMIIRTVVCLLVLLIFVLFLLPASLYREVGTEEEAEGYLQKRATMEQAALTGEAATMLVTESELNAYLAQVVATPPEQSSLFSARVLDAGVRMGDNRVRIFVKTAYGPLRLSGTFTVRPRGTGFRVTSAKAGQLFLPGFLGRTYYFLRHKMFDRMVIEDRILRNTEVLSVSDGEVELMTVAE